MMRRDSQPWPDDDPERKTLLLGLIRIGLAEAVRVRGELGYRLILLRDGKTHADLEYPEAQREPTALS